MLGAQNGFWFRCIWDETVVICDGSMRFFAGKEWFEKKNLAVAHLKNGERVLT